MRVFVSKISLFSWCQNNKVHSLPSRVSLRTLCLTVWRVSAAVLIFFKHVQVSIQVFKNCQDFALDWIHLFNWAVFIQTGPGYTYRKKNIKALSVAHGPVRSGAVRSEGSTWTWWPVWVWAEPWGKAARQKWVHQSPPQNWCGEAAPQCHRLTPPDGPEGAGGSKNQTDFVFNALVPYRSDPVRRFKLVIKS